MVEGEGLIIYQGVFDEPPDDLLRALVGLTGALIERLGLNVALVHVGGPMAFKNEYMLQVSFRDDQQRKLMEKARARG